MVRVSLSAFSSTPHEGEHSADITRKTYIPHSTLNERATRDRWAQARSLYWYPVSAVAQQRAGPQLYSSPGLRVITVDSEREERRKDSDPGVSLKRSDPKLTKFGHGN